MSAPGAPAQTDTPRRSALSYLQQTLKHGSIYSLGLILSRLVSFVMIPIYTRVLTPADYGVLEILSLSTDVLSMLLGFGVGLAVVRYYFRYESIAERNAVVSSAAILLLSMFLSFAVVGIVFERPIALLLLGADGSPYLVRLAIISMALGVTIEVPFAYLRARQRSTSVVGYSLTRLFLSVGFNIVLVVWFRLGVAGILYSTILTSTIIGGTLLWRTLRETGIRFSAPIARALMAYGAPLVIWNIASFVMHFSDRYFLRTFTSLAVVGVYSLSYKFAMLVATFVSGPFNDIWISKALEIERAEGADAPPILRSILGYYSLLLATAALGVALFGGDVIRIVSGRAFHDAAQAIPLLALAMVFFGLRSVAQIGAMIREQSHLIAWATSCAAGLVLLLNLVLIPRFGMMGAATATAVAFGAEFLIMRTLSARVYPMRVPLHELLRPVAIGVGAWILTTVLRPPGAGIVLSVAIGAASFALYLVGLIVLRGVAPDQRALVFRALRSPAQTLRTLRGA